MLVDVLVTGDPFALVLLRRYRLAVKVKLKHVVVAKGLLPVSLSELFSSVG